MGRAALLGIVVGVDMKISDRIPLSFGVFCDGSHPDERAGDVRRHACEESESVYQASR